MKKNARRITGITAAALVLIAGAATALAIQTGPYLTVNEAKTIAMTHAGVAEGGYYGYEFSFDMEHGVEVYEIDFKTAEHEYEYDINAVTGEILKDKKEFNDDIRKPKKFQNVTASEAVAQTPAAPAPEAVVQTPAAPAPEATAQTPVIATPDTADYITADEAKAIAMTHAGVAEGDYYNYEFGFDIERGIAVYEVDFKTLENEYEYDINAVTGEIVKDKKEYNDDRYEAEAILGKKKTDASAEVSTTYITPEDAKSIALSDAGVHENNVYDFELDFDTEHGIAVYELDFESMNYEHEYDINAATGEIIKSDKEPRD